MIKRPSPNPTVAIASVTMPKGKKQNQLATLPPHRLPLPECEDTGEQEYGSHTRAPSFLAPIPMAHGMPGDPKSSLSRGSPESRESVIPPLLSLPPHWDRGPVRGGLGLRYGSYSHGWWGDQYWTSFFWTRSWRGPSMGGFIKSREIL